MSRSARAVMVLGTTSHAGKSWLATALCRWYARQGLTVAPFKAQNMSNNARVVPGPDGDGAEIGSAQYFQALAARARPDVRMNPVLLKPERDTASQVVVLGRVRPDLADVPWHRRSALLAPLAADALRQLQASHDLVVVEGAGSPAEINLQASDYVNLGTLRDSRAAALVVADIDRGGAFAHLYGTHRLLPDDVRGQVRGFVLNRFRGDASLLVPGPQQLQALTGVPTVAVLPLWRGHGLPEEDGVAAEAPSDDPAPSSAVAPRRIAIVAWPRISNLDEFQPLRQLRGVHAAWARRPQDLAGADLVILPGSKHTSGDLAWLRAHGLAAPLAAHAASGKPLLGICGGLQVLGAALHDPHGVDGAAECLGLLPVETTFNRDKRLVDGEARFAALEGFWQPWSGRMLRGYQIRHGRTAALPGAGVHAVLHDADGTPVGWQQGNVLGACVHGLFEQPALLEALFGETVRPLDAVFDGLADFIDHHFEPGALMRLTDPA